MVPKKHHSKSKVGRRRSHLALKPPTIGVCLACKGPIFGHTACGQCGIYKQVTKKTSVSAKKKEEPVTAEVVTEMNENTPDEKTDITTDEAEPE